MASTTNPNSLPANPDLQNANQPSVSDKQKSTSSTNDKTSLEQPKLNQTNEPAITKKEEKLEANTQKQAEKQEKDVTAKSDAKEIKSQEKDEEKGKNKSSEEKGATVEGAIKKQNTIVDDKNPSQTVIYEREPSREIGRINSMKKTKEATLEHKTSLESAHSKPAADKENYETRKGDNEKEVNDPEEADKEENKANSKEKVESKQSLKEAKKEDETASKEENNQTDKKEKSDTKEESVYPSVEIGQNDDSKLTEIGSKAIETKTKVDEKGEETETEKSVKGEKTQEVDAFKKKIEKIVEAKMEKEVDKLVEKKVQMLLKKQEEVKPTYVSAKTKESVSDGYLFTSPNPSDYGTNSTLGKHTRFWEIEKRIQELKDKHHRTFMDQPPVRDQSPSKSYISAIRDRLTSLPPIMSNLSNYERSLSPTNEDTPVYFAEEGPKRPARMPPKGRPVEDNRAPKQLDRSTRAKSKQLPPQPIPQYQNRQMRNEKPQNPNTMPKLYETYMGRDFTKKIPNKPNSNANKARSSSSKPRFTSTPGTRPGEQQVYRLVTQNTDDGRYQIVGFNSRGTAQLTDDPEVVFFAEDQSHKKANEMRKGNSRGHMYGSAEMITSGRRNSVKNIPKRHIQSGDSADNSRRRNVSHLSTPQTVEMVRNAASNKGSNLLRNNAQRDQWSSVGQKNNFVVVRKEKRSSSVITEVNESNLLSDAVTFHGSQESLKPKRITSSVKRSSMQRIDSGSLIRQVYRVKGMSRENSNSDLEDLHNKTYDVADGNRSYLLSGNRERKRSTDYSILPGKGFTTAQRTVLMNHYESPGPKYDLSSYKSLVGENKLKVEDYIVKKSARSPEARTPHRQEQGLEESPGKESQLSGGLSSKRTTKGPIFGTARREILFKYKADTPGPGDYDMPQIHSKHGAHFGKERKSFRSAFPKMADIKHVKP